jgi:hypothetical protein
MVGVLGGWGHVHLSHKMVFSLQEKSTNIELTSSRDAGENACVENFRSIIKINVTPHILVVDAPIVTKK